MTKAEKWSVTVKKRRLSWLGHILRLNEETSVKRTLKEYLRKIKKKKEKRKTCWIDVIKKDFEWLQIKNEEELI